MVHGISWKDLSPINIFNVSVRSLLQCNALCLWLSRHILFWIHTTLSCHFVDALLFCSVFLNIGQNADKLSIWTFVIVSSFGQLETGELREFHIVLNFWICLCDVELIPPLLRQPKNVQTGSFFTDGVALTGKSCPPRLVGVFCNHHL